MPTFVESMGSQPGDLLQLESQIWRYGTLFHNRKTDDKDILECLALLTEGVHISSTSRSKGIKAKVLLTKIRSG